MKLFMEMSIGKMGVLQFLFRKQKEQPSSLSEERNCCLRGKAWSGTMLGSGILRPEVSQACMVQRTGTEHLKTELV